MPNKGNENHSKSSTAFDFYNEFNFHKSRVTFDHLTTIIEGRTSSGRVKEADRGKVEDARTTGAERFSSFKVDEIISKKINNLYRCYEGIRSGRVFTNFTPLEFHIEHTDQCNLRCNMCIAHHHLVTKNKQQLDIRLLEKLEPYFEPCVVGRLVGAGEPFTNKQFMEYARMFSTKLCRLACTTNGTLINGKTARSLIETQFDYLIISLDAARKETFEQIRKGASFNRVIHNIRRLVRLKKKNGSFFPIISYSMVVMNQNIQELVPLVELVHDLGGCHLNVVPMTIPFKSLPASYVRFYRENALCLSDNVESTRKVFELADRKAKELNVNLTCNVDAIFSRPAPEQIEINTSSNVPSQLTVSNLNVDAEKLNVASDIKPEPGYCVWPWAQFYLRKDGKVALCCNAAIFLYGDLHEQSIEEISNSRGIMAVRRAILEGRFPTVACKLCYIRSQNASLDYLGSNLLQIMRKFNYIG